MKVVFALAADYASLDPSGKASLIGLFTMLNVPTVPATHPRMHLLLCFEQEPDDVGRHIAFRVIWNDPDRRQPIEMGHGSVGVVAHATDGPPRTTIAIPVENLRLDAFGPHAFTIEVDDQPPFESPIFVKQVPPAPSR